MSHEELIPQSSVVEEENVLGYTWTFILVLASQIAFSTK